MTDRKYPAHYSYFPAGFGEGESDNKNILSVGGKIYKEPFKVLEPSPDALGINKKSVKISTTIAFGEIYVIWAVGTTLYKIGVSTNFCRRFKDLSSVSPLPLEAIRYARCDNPHLLESHLHAMMAHKLFKNEWFSLDADDLSTVFSLFDRYFEKPKQKIAGVAQ